MSFFPQADITRRDIWPHAPAVARTRAPALRRPRRWADPPIMRAHARPGQACSLVTFLLSPPPAAGSSGASLGALPDPTSLPPLPSFEPADGSSSGLGILAAATATSKRHDGRSRDSDPAPPVSAALHAAGPYNPASTLPPKVVKRILALEFVEMSELRGDIWPKDSTASDPHVTPRRSAKPPVNSIKKWLECYARMASILVPRFRRRPQNSGLTSRPSSKRPTTTKGQIGSP